MKHDFEMPVFSCSHEFTRGQLEALEIKPHPLPADWLEQNISLCGGYLNHGPIKFKPWQREVVNAPIFYDVVLDLGPTQTGKSFMSEGFGYYCMGARRVNGFLTYAESDTAETVFSEKVKPMIENNEILAKQWNGDQKRLTVKRVRLNQCTWRIASAQNKNDIASHHAGVCIGSEVGKWEKTKKFNPVSLLKGRQGAYHDKGFQKLVLETTPFEIGDYMYQEVYQEGTLILHPFYPCPHCGNWHEYTDHQIKVRDEKFKSANMIRRYKQDAVYYECPHCKREITEHDRATVDDRVVWAAPEINKEDFHQIAEEIHPDGSIDGVLENGYRPWVLRICYQWPRGVDINYSWWKWLADYFEAKNDPVKLKTYQNEVNANYFTPKTSGLNVAYIESKKGGYTVRGENVIIPDDILIVTLGIDTHDGNFTYVYVGWCFGLVWKVLKHGIIPCDMNLQEFKDPVNVFIRLQSELAREKMYWQGGIEVFPSCTFQDRGGHRAKDVDYIASKMPNWYAYVGLTKADHTKPVFYESNNGPFYLGQTELLSELTNMKIYSDDFFIPDDYHPEFPRQVARQSFFTKTNANGNPIKIWNHGGDDHFRDCLNLNECAGRKLGLDKILIDKVACETLYNQRKQLSDSVRMEQHEQHHSENNHHRQASGYNRVFGRR